MKFLLTILTLITSLLAPIKGLLLIMILFSIYESTLEVYATLKLKETFKSENYIDVIMKTFFYLFSIVIAFFIDKYIFGISSFGIEYLSAKFVTAICIYKKIITLDELNLRLGNKSIWKLLKEFFVKSKEIKNGVSSIVEDDDKEEK